MSAGLILVIVGFVGSSALGLLAFLMGFNKNSKIESHAQLEAIVHTFAPHVRVSTGIIATTKAAALAKCADASLYLITMLGDRPVVRTVSKGNIELITKGHIRINLNDFGAPPFDFKADATLFDMVLNGDQKVSAL